MDASGYQAVITQAVTDTYEDIQRYRDDWDFLQAQKTIAVGPSQDIYPLATLWGTETPDLARWKHINYDYRRLQEMEWNTYELYDFSNWTGQKPIYWAWRPYDYALCISPVGTNYSLEMYYYKELDILTLNTSVPIIPTRHHQLLVYGALMKVASYLGNMTLFDTYSIKYAEELGQLMREANPPKRIYKRPIA